MSKSLATIKKGYKNTTIGIIPEDWEVVRLFNLLENETIPSGVYKDKKLYGKGTKIIKLGDVFKNDIYKPEDTQRVVLAKAEIEKYKVKIGDIIVALASVKLEGVGKVMLINKLDETTSFDHNVALIRLKKDNSNYLSYQFKSRLIREEVAAKATQVGTTFLKASSLKKFLIPLPPLPEQTAIATVLSDTDNLLQVLEKKIAKKRLIKQGAMQLLLKHKEGWVVKSLGEVFEITAGGDLRSNEFSAIKTAEFPFSIFSNAQTNLGLYGFCKTYDYEGNAITISARGGIGYTVSRFNKFAAIGRLLVLKPSDDVDCKFIEEFININIEFSSESTGVPQLTAPQVSKYKVSFPLRKEQTRIATILFDMDNEIESLEKQLAKCKQVKQGLMQVLLTGKIRLV